MAKSTEYDPLPSSEDEEHIPHPSRSKSGIFKKSAVFFLVTLCGFLGVLGIFDLVLRITPTKSYSSNSGPRCYCGNSVEEAKSLGCAYVPLAAAWLPVHCRDEYLEEEFNLMGPNPDHSWPYYADYKRETAIDIDAMANQAGTENHFFSEWEAHVVHCMFYWRKLQRAQFTGVVVEPRYNTDAHISHCTRLILGGHGPYPQIATVTLGNESISEEEQRRPVAWDDVREMLNVNRLLPM